MWNVHHRLLVHLVYKGPLGIQTLLAVNAIMAILITALLIVTPALFNVPHAQTTQTNVLLVLVLIEIMLQNVAALMDFLQTLSKPNLVLLAAGNVQPA